ncbi:MAG: stalk domain-containing protein [Thermincola sp.]|jgi:hypothetical protein|nr:stalk domain-containing protein [Thermincola sp.]MDT3702015.1 stalk domain-containing protein [Thermincola sp.]
MKKYWWISLVLLLVLAIPVGAAQVIKIYVNGAELKSDVPAQIINGRTMVPIRAIAEYFGKEVSWDDKTKTVTISGTNLDLVSKISKEWSTAGHAKTVEPLAYSGIRDGCMPCHAGNGLQQYGTDKPFTPSKNIVSNPIATDKAYLEKDPNNKNYTFMFDPHAAELPRTIDCAACHSGTGAEIMKSGVIPAKLNVFSGGTADLKVGNKNALCFTCHNGRRDVDKIYKDWTDPKVSNANVYPHHGWGSLVSGQGGMEYPGVTYAQSTTHQSLGCIGCHMGKTKEGYVSHEFKPNIATCNKCHPGQTEFTMGGSLKKELETKMATLEKLILAKIPGAVEVGVDNATAPAVDKDGQRIDAKNVTSVEALVGAYNYAIIHWELEQGAKGAHNPKYARALLDESIKALQK